MTKKILGKYNLPVLEAFNKEWVELKYVERLINILLTKGESSRKK